MPPSPGNKRKEVVLALARWLSPCETTGRVAMLSAVRRAANLARRVRTTQRQPRRLGLVLREERHGLTVALRAALERTQWP